jgi:hypothetical protein
LEKGMGGWSVKSVRVSNNWTFGTNPTLWQKFLGLLPF